MLPIQIEQEKIAKATLEVIAEKLVNEINDADLDGDDREIDSYIVHIGTLYCAYVKSRDEYQKIVNKAYEGEQL